MAFKPMNTMPVQRAVLQSFFWNFVASRTFFFGWPNLTKRQNGLVGFPGSFFEGLAANEEGLAANEAFAVGIVPTGCVDCFGHVAGFFFGNALAGMTTGLRSA